MDRSLGLGYAWGSTFLLSGLIASLAIWYAREGSLRVYPIVRRDVELLFWLTVLLSNSLGTAFGDFLVDVVGLTFLQGALVTAGVIAAKTLGLVRRGPLAMHATWEVQPIRMLRLLVEIEEAEKARAHLQSSVSGVAVRL